MSVTQNGQSVYDYTYDAKASYNDDLIINESWEQELTEIYGPDGEFVSSNSTSIYKSDAFSEVDDDWENDGVADYYLKSKETITESSGKLVEIEWESSDRGPGTLTIGISKDFDGDQIYDQSRSFSFRFGAPSSWTAMGEHVASLEDTLLPPTDSAALL